MSEPQPTVLELLAQIVSAHCSHNTVAAEALPSLIQQVHLALMQAEQPEPASIEKPVPVVHPKKSVFPDYIVCLEDGKKLKMLKRHLTTAYGMTPQQYREKWELPANYPMTAPNYAERRSELAKQLGFGLGLKSGAKVDPETDVKVSTRRRRVRASTLNAWTSDQPARRQSVSARLNAQRDCHDE